MKMNFHSPVSYLYGCLECIGSEHVGQDCNAQFPKQNKKTHSPCIVIVKNVSKRKNACVHPMHLVICCQFQIVSVSIFRKCNLEHWKIYGLMR